MIWLFVLIGAVAVGVVAVAALGIAVGRLENETAPVVYELEDAVDFIGDRLPAEVTARVSYDDVRRVLRWHLDWFASVGLATPHGEELGDAAVEIDDIALADSEGAIDSIVARSLRDQGPEAVDVVCILELQNRFLAKIGAVGDERPETDV